MTDKEWTDRHTDGIRSEKKTLESIVSCCIRIATGLLVHRPYILHASSEVFHVAQEQLREVTLSSEEHAEMDVQLEESSRQFFLHYGVVHLRNSIPNVAFDEELGAPLKLGKQLYTFYNCGRWKLNSHLALP